MSRSPTERKRRRSTAVWRHSVSPVGTSEQQRQRRPDNTRGSGEEESRDSANEARDEPRRESRHHNHAPSLRRHESSSADTRPIEAHLRRPSASANGATRADDEAGSARTFPALATATASSPATETPVLTKSSASSTTFKNAAKPAHRSAPSKPPPPPSAAAKAEGADQSKSEESPKEDTDAVATSANFGLSGKLAAETNTVNGVVLKYSEPAEARKPSGHWRIYVFKDGKDIDMHRVDTASAYLFGRDRKVADVPIDHPSCSSQHAVLQYRLTDSNTIKPYLIDLASTNGTFLNGDKVSAQRYIELRSEDLITFGFSTREYILLHE
ncbi:SMAD/FHA domain-containing protein [Kickxella alabastrina]|uniref:SMAD/FHA domain-containing protein n=1 Tax=Kickxella alabastrina TaxID=61397 RepID=UPI00221F3BC7|nr:SMAD/FHA domain-containing protein [Kickxella alabastrina]KAI7827779.1 SMAD/FHA domain-containing protein [Kickxella alabastrina]